MKHECPNCGSGVAAERWNAGYHYCKDRHCFELLGRKKHVQTYVTAPDPAVEVSVFELDEVFPEDDGTD